MSNYKLEVENTEKLKNDINSAFTEINTELEKDDDLMAKDLFDVDKKIEELKNSRKKYILINGLLSGEAISNSSFDTVEMWGSLKKIAYYEVKSNMTLNNAVGLFTSRYNGSYHLGNRVHISENYIDCRQDSNDILVYKKINDKWYSYKPGTLMSPIKWEICNSNQLEYINILLDGLENNKIYFKITNVADEYSDYKLSYLYLTE